VRHTTAADQPDQVAQFYADRMADFPELVEMPDYLVVKTHTADALLRWLWRIAGGPLLITVREPRDAVASLMSRFGFPFDVALKNVGAAAACMVDLAALGASLVLRYEDRFFDREKTMVSLARCLGVKVSTPVARRIFGSLTRAAVAEKIDELTRQGVSGPDATSERFDPKTHWHPGHLGSGETGRYRQVLLPGQQAQVTLATQEFCRVFGYPTELPEGVSRTCPIGKPIMFGKAHDSAQLLTEGWGLPGGSFIWAIGERSQITLDVGDLPAHPDAYRLRLAVQPFTAYGVPFQRVSIFLNDCCSQRTASSNRRHWR
jgi:hypothetical protein